MPKVFSHTTVSSSETATATQSSRAILRSYYCLCGDFLLVIQGKLDRLPRRKRDGAYIIRCEPGPNPEQQPARKFKLNAREGERCLIKKRDSDSLEVRQPFSCSRCNTTVAYQSIAGPAGSGPFLYILQGSMTELQGVLPDDAFEGEDALPPKPAES